MAFFPNYLKWRYRMYNIAKRTPISQSYVITIEEVLKHYREQNKWWEPHLFLDHITSSENTDNIDDLSYEIAINSELRKVLYWISKRIMLSIIIDNYMTLDVYVRIGTSMINKLVNESIISKEFGMIYHDNLVRNIGDVISSVNEESLPF